MHRTIKDVVNINSLRNEKQKGIDNHVKELFSDLFHFVERNANIREKVRAKHIFCEQSNMSLVQLEEGEIQKKFRFWLCFDYVNIQGMTMFQLYLQQHAAKVSENTLRVVAFLLALTLEPIIVTTISKCKTVLSGKNILTNEVKEIRSFDQPYTNICKDDLVVGWTAKLGYDKKIIGPYTVITNKKALSYSNDIIKMYYYEKMRVDLPSWRSFMKLHGINFLFPSCSDY
jgi:hypothetical protein